MAFNYQHKKNNQNNISVVQSNTTYRMTTQEKYQLYEYRILTLARFYNWDEDKIKSSLSLANWNTPPVERRLEQLEQHMNKIVANSQESIAQKKSQNPNNVVFKIIADEEKLYSIGAEHNLASPMLDGLIFNKVPISLSPFKSEENVRHIVQEFDVVKPVTKKLKR